MKRIFTGYFFLLMLVACSSSQKVQQTNVPALAKSLLWEISGNGLEKPSYLYGTIHMICEDDAILSDSLKAAIQRTDRLYLEVDMDNLIEMMGALQNMKMKNDTTLADLLSEENYEKVKDYMESRSTLIPFSMLETYKPMLASSLLLESGLSCESPVAMEQLIMEEAKKNHKRVDGLETMAYQMGIFDSIPYKVQAEQLLKYISSDDNEAKADKEFKEMMQAYKDQDIERLGEFIRNSEDGLEAYEDMLLFHRNRNWVNKLKKVMEERPVTIAVGAGHLSGEKGVINLLRKEGYKVRAVNNKMPTQRVI